MGFNIVSSYRLYSQMTSHRLSYIFILFKGHWLLNYQLMYKRHPIYKFDHQIRTSSYNICIFTKHIVRKQFIIFRIVPNISLIGIHSQRVTIDHYFEQLSN
jgi:hypothetical protein